MSDKVGVPLSELVEAKKNIHEALSPKATFQKDVEKRREEAEEVSKHALYLLLGWISKYVRD